MNVTAGETKQRRTVHLLEHEEIYHKAYRDTVKICNKDTACADVLRVYEVLSNQRAAWLVEEYGIPEPFYPHEDDLWIDEQILLDLEWFTSWNRRHSTYARVVADISSDPRRPSLVQRGYLKVRYIARPYDKFYEPDPDEIKAPIYRDERGYFLLVKNRNGAYIGNDGSLCCARSQGFHCVVRQYRVEVDTVQARLSKSRSVWGEPSEPLQRHQPIVQRIPGRQQKGSADVAGETTKSTNSYTSAIVRSADTQNVREADTIQPASSGVIASSALKHNTPSYDLSRDFPNNSQIKSEPVTSFYGQTQLYRDTVDVVLLRCAPWSPETILGLSSLRLPIPARPPDEDAEALRKWIANWWEPAQRLYLVTLDLSPLIAWEHIDCTIQYMDTPGSPSWWQRDQKSGKDWRKTKAPITLRNVADHFVIQWDDYLKQRSWSAREIIPYDGPPLGMIGDDREAPPEQLVAVTGVSEVVDQAPDREEAADFPPNETGMAEESMQTEPTTDEMAAVLPRRRRKGMNAGAAEHLAEQIAEHYPGLIAEFDEIKPGCYLLNIWYGDGEDQWFALDLVTWWHLTPELQDLIDQAVFYAASMASGEPPLSIESEENNGGYTAAEESAPLSSNVLLEPGTHGADHCSGGLHAPISSG